MDHSHHHCASCDKENAKRDFTLLIIAIVCTLPLLFNMFFHVVPVWIQFVLSAVVQFVCGATFYKSSYQELKSWAIGMDTLIALGTSVAFFYSAFVFLFHLNFPLYFETNATIITLVLLGQYLESLSQSRGRKAVESLYSLAPKQAIVWKENDWREIPLEEVEKGDLFQIRPGTSVPIDGEVVEGTSEINESVLTGESLPVYKEKGSHVYMATQNGSGSLVAKVTATAKNTTFAHIVQMMKEAEATRAPIQKIADKVSGVFVPVVILFSIFTFLVWYLGFGSSVEGVLSAVAVLVIACPCALGMATPIVFLMAVERGARSGIIYKNLEALETAEKLQAIAFDKTGTLTTGKFLLSEVIPQENHSKEEVIRLAASLESYSEHPIAKVIADSSTQKERVTDFKAHVGRGVEGKINGKLYFFGSTRFMKQQVDLKAKEGETLLCLSNEEKILGYFLVKDGVRMEARQVVEGLRELNIQSLMLTGDKKETAVAVGKEVGITQVHAEILPDQKINLIEELKKEMKVGMVGDGINDAPALAASHCSFSMGGGTDIATRASDVTLMRNDLRGILAAIQLSKETFKKVRQNLFFAFIYNILAIPLAAFGLLNPMIAGLAMALSSLTVVLNSILWKEPS
jgi:Cu+-exporting ATPase